MKKIFPVALFLASLFIPIEKAFSQNIAVNTTGTAAASTNMFEVTQSSTAANMVALYAIHNGATGAGLTGYGLQAIKTGATGTNVAGYFSASGGANNYGIIVPSGGGNVGIGLTAPTTKLHVLSSLTTSGDAAIFGNQSGASGQVYGIVGQVASTSGNATGVKGIASGTSGGTNGVWGTNASSTTDAAGVWGESTSSTGAVYGVFGSSASTTSPSSGVVGKANGATGLVYGVTGISVSSGGVGVFGDAWNTTAGGTVYGVYGRKRYSMTSGTGYGVYGTAEGTATTNIGGYFTATGATSNYGLIVPSGGGNVGIGTSAPSYLVHATTSLASGTVGAFINSNATGTGIAAAGNGVSINIPANGMGGAFTGSSIGAAGYSLSGSNPTGVLGSGNNLLGGYVMIGGGGGAFTGTISGIEGRTTTSPSGSSAGAFFLGGTANYSYSGYNNAGTFYGLITNGAKSTVIKDQNGKSRIMFCTESPEILFEDYGTGKLINGRTHIEIDSLFAYSIIVDEKHPLRVFIQLKGDCNGVYVTNETSHGFDVVELKGGTSSVSFSYHIIGNRKDDNRPAGELTSKFANNRYPVFEKDNVKDIWIDTVKRKD